jgi:hypothetical protein
MEFTHEGFVYYVNSDGQYMRDVDAPEPPAEMLARWRFEAREAFYRDVAADVTETLRREAAERRRYRDGE